MPSELQRVAQQLLATLDEIPRVVAYLHDRASKYRESAGWVGSMSNNPSARMAAMQLEEAGRRCEEAAHFLSLAPPKARSWVEQMVSGVRTAEPAGGSTARRPDAPGGSPPPAERRQDDEQVGPEAKKHRRAAGAGDEASPEEVPPKPTMSDEEGWRLFGKLPVRDETKPVRQKTRGIWRDEDGNEQPLVSGQRLGEGDDPYYQQVKNFMREHRIGRQDGEPMVASHVEAKFALFMRERGRMHETIAVNKVSCDGDLSCDELLKQFLPPGGTLTVFGPGGFKETYPKPE
jgi:hypothetical protein